MKFNRSKRKHQYAEIWVKLSVKQVTGLKPFVTSYFVIREYPIMEHELNVVNLMQKILTPVNFDSKRIGNLLDH